MFSKAGHIITQVPGNAGSESRKSPKIKVDLDVQNLITPVSQLTISRPMYVFSLSYAQISAGLTDINGLADTAFYLVINLFPTCSLVRLCL